ncbi:class I SAM-dependent methyltransferase [Flavobacterium sp. DG1-102-2]|uniref:class I SAM-dependent methyltransferase n=1 Tax=Flavobacterium sp. DG1-102-2 TaxID=3081663 RepID=UPI00294A09AC|nr:class I SAM-dependent methyltransferase [Flavobacterium sp. DG1-102-2]MDV6168123.1 class I SAM-dependent methyltransferase [Flavobacterium sp. DG1-102-2]
MYGIAKKLAIKIIGKKKIFKYEQALRKIYAAGYTGSKHQCNICGKKLSRFIILPHNNDKLCPSCGSLARDRRLWQIENSGFIKEGITFLDFSPSRSLSNKLKKVKSIKYISTDLSGNFNADHRYDITNIDLPDSSIDLIVCYHVLEHIDNDALAMTELYRILKPGGHALIQTPYKEGDIYENPLIKSPQEREIHFGQDDHVRIYTVHGLKQRLENAGFDVEVKTFNANAFNGLTANETILIVRKI